MKRRSLIITFICLMIIFSSLGVMAADDTETKSYIKLKEGSWIAGYPVEWNYQNEMEYIRKRKNPALASGLAIAVPSLGHAYAGNWGRGLGFLGAELAEGFIMTWALTDTKEEIQTDYYGNYYSVEVPNESNDWIGALAYMAYLGTRYWEIFDAYETTQVENARLKHEISVSFKRDQLRLSANYNF